LELLVSLLVTSKCSAHKRNT